ncbi:hypothetical protein PsYK624_019770 [Phanerochaete sordida]|uniref:Uncharacterized protein n=1 Tax=Phanerochaete sordida TaxID=48140 RepID=A0A9P3G0C5_9APHY|nr:hypothetical protein PsYK624_019770 [Phanerochaete sordida]
MPATEATGLPQRTRPMTRASLKSLNFSSMGKALADAMHKDSKDSVGEKEKGKRVKDSTVSKRSSLVPPPATSADKTATVRREKAASPDATAAVKSSRRLSGVPKPSGGTSSEEQCSPNTISPKISAKRASSVRPRSSLITTSALPKYRPRSMHVESAGEKRGPSPPARAGTRRRLSTSDDDKGDKEEKGKSMLLDLTKPTQKTTRAISPLPHRNALQVNLTTAINVTPSTPSTPEKKNSKAGATASRTSSSPTRVPSPTRPKQTKAAKPAAATITRPPSSASSSSSSRAPISAPSTPTIIRRIAHRSNGSVRTRTDSGPSPSPLRTSIPSGPDSPFANVSVRKKTSRGPTPSSSRSSLITNPTPIILTADSSMDSMEANDVEFMLSQMASPSAPTPALPRFRTIDLLDEPAPATPQRLSPFTLPSRANLSYLSPAPPSTDGSPFLRPQRRGMPVGNERGSILSWEQLAQHNQSMGTPDVDQMLAEVDAPFRSLMASPTPSHLTLADIPESPTLSAMPSPSGYGSISQVLLPDVTPAPAPHPQLRYYDDSAEPSPIESSNATMLRLQLASVEIMAQERLARIAALEAQLAAATEARLRDAEELAQQISTLEEQVHGNLAKPEADKLARYAASLEEQLAQAQILRDEAVAEALKRAALDAVASQRATLQKQQAMWSVSAAACDAHSAWRAVKCTAEGELEAVRSSREVLNALLAGLSQSLQQSV